MSENITQSFKISEMSLEQLVQLNQGLGHQIERLREQRVYLKNKIDERHALQLHEQVQSGAIKLGVAMAVMPWFKEIIERLSKAGGEEPAEEVYDPGRKDATVEGVVIEIDARKA